MKYQLDLNVQAREWAEKRTKIITLNDTPAKIAEEAWLAGNAVVNQEWFNVKDFLPDLNQQVIVYGRAKDRKSVV